jgi:hypothetical protein
VQGSQDDPFGTAELRRRVLEAWTASPARFREDANAEEDYALGGYRDRVIVELAQNAADAAARAGVPGRLRLTLTAGPAAAGPPAAGTPGGGTPAAGTPGGGTPAAGTLVAANTGAPLDAAGVEALSTLRASSKRGADEPAATAGRFGVGFAAAVAVSDEPRISSLTGTVAWSRSAARDLAGQIPAVAAELAGRAGQLPVLRLPFAADGAPPAGFTTAVTLPLRDEAAAALTARLLAEAGPALLLALPALAAIEIEAGGVTRMLTAVHDGDGVTITDDGTVSRWRTAAAGGRAAPQLLADRPAEERARPAWSVRWAVPVAGDASAELVSGELAAAELAGDSTRGSTSGELAGRPASGELAGRLGSEPAGRLPDGTAGVVHAPTPTDEVLSLPALLLASFPLSPDRRHVAPGPLTDFLVDRAAEVYAGLLPGLAGGNGLLSLVPPPVPRGELDGQLGRAILARLPETPFLPAVAVPAAATRPGERNRELDPGGTEDPAGAGDSSGTGDLAGAEDLARLETAGLGPGQQTGRGPGSPPGLRVRPRDALILETRLPGLPAVLAAVLPGLISGPPRHQAYAVLGVQRMSLAGLADALAALHREPAWWRELYAALAPAEPAELGELGALPVPLASGRQVTGPRGLLLPAPELADPQRLELLGLRVVHPGAAHPLLTRLGAIEATPRSVLGSPEVRARVEASYDEEDPGPVADAVLSLVAAAGLQPGELPWLAELALPGADGEWYPAGELLLPGGALAGVVAPDTPFGTASPELADRYGAAALEAAGVLASFALLAARDVPLDEPGLNLDGEDEWIADTCDRLPGDLPPVAPELLAVRDLELVDPDRWPAALELLAVPPLRAALTEPTRLLLADGHHSDVPSYTAWWLRQHPVLGGRRGADVRIAGGDPLLAGLWDDFDWPGDPAVARALGARTTLAGLLAEPGGIADLLSRLADPARPVTRGQLRAVWAAVAAADAAGAAEPDPPGRIRAVLGDQVVVADAADVLVLDVPDRWPLVAARPLVLAPYDQAERLADLLDLPLVSEEVPGRVESAGQRRPVPAIVTAVLPDAPAEYQAHDPLVVDGTELPWRCMAGAVHAAGPDGLARGLAWAAGQWPSRHLLAALLQDSGAAPRLLAEADLDGGLAPAR